MVHGPDAEPEQRTVDRHLQVLSPVTNGVCISEQNAASLREAFKGLAAKADEGGLRAIDIKIDMLRVIEPIVGKDHSVLIRNHDYLRSFHTSQEDDGGQMVRGILHSSSDNFPMET